MSIKPLIAAVAAAPLFAGAAVAGPYVNVESNLSYPDGDYNDGTTDLHVGYEGSTDKVSYYIQAGPGFVHTDSTDDTETEISGKVGASVAVSDDLSVSHSDPVCDIIRRETLKSPFFIRNLHEIRRLL